MWNLTGRGMTGESLQGRRHGKKGGAVWKSCNVGGRERA